MRTTDLFIIIGEILTGLAIIIAGFIPYHLVTTTATATEAQHTSRADLEATWDSTPITKLPDTTPKSSAGDQPILPDPPEGEPIGIMRIPALGDDWEYVIHQGVDQNILAEGPGAYSNDTNTSDTAANNYAIAGHRDGWDAPFGDLDKLNTCDIITIETDTAIQSWAVLPPAGTPQQRADELSRAGNCLSNVTDGPTTISHAPYNDVPGNHIVSPTDAWVTHPIPGHEDTAALRNKHAMHLLTLTTCHPHWSNQQRLVIHAAYVGATEKNNSKLPQR